MREKGGNAGVRTMVDRTPTPKHCAPAAGPSSSAQTTGVKRRIEASKHPLAGIGGYQVPIRSGTVGAARGVGAPHTAVAQKAKVEAERAKKAKPMSKEEEEFMARREAARKRVEERTRAAFGM